MTVFNSNASNTVRPGVPVELIYASQKCRLCEAGEPATYLKQSVIRVRRRLWRFIMIGEALELYVTELQREEIEEAMEEDEEAEERAEEAQNREIDEAIANDEGEREIQQVRAQRAKCWHLAHAAFFERDLEASIPLTKRVYFYYLNDPHSSEQRSFLRPVNPNDINNEDCVICRGPLQLFEPHRLPCDHALERKTTAKSLSTTSAPTATKNLRMYYVLPSMALPAKQCAAYTK